MKHKLVFLLLFTAFLSVSCVSNARVFSAGNQEPGVRGKFSPTTLTRTDRVAGGKCVAKLTYDEESGYLKKVETDPPCVVKEEQLLVNGHELVDFSGSITFGGSCRTCYPSVYGPPKCIIDYTRNC